MLDYAYENKADLGWAVGHLAIAPQQQITARAKVSAPHANPTPLSPGHLPTEAVQNDRERENLSSRSGSDVGELTRKEPTAYLL